MTKAPKQSELTEAAIAAALMDYLIGDGWDCYPEVECAGGRADIVAVRPFPFMPHRRCVHIFETKTTWSLVEAVAGTRAWAKVEAMKWQEVREVRNKLWNKTRGHDYGAKPATLVEAATPSAEASVAGKETATATEKAA